MNDQKRTDVHSSTSAADAKIDASIPSKSAQPSSQTDQLQDTNDTMTSGLVGTALIARIVASLEDDKAQEIVTIDLKGKSTFADSMVIASGTSARQINAMSDHLVERLKAEGLDGVTSDGKEQGDWILIDAGDAIVHLFRPEVREFYNLEKLWSAVGTQRNAPKVSVGDDGPTHDPLAG